MRRRSKAILWVLLLVAVAALLYYGEPYTGTDGWIRPCEDDVERSEVAQAYLDARKQCREVAR